MNKISDLTFCIETRYKRRPNHFKERVAFTENGDRDYAFIARPNGLNELTGRQRLYIVDVHFTEKDIFKMIETKFKKLKLPIPKEYQIKIQ